MLKRYLEKSSLFLLACLCQLFIFLIYTCAYGFRKPFTAGIYAGEMLWGFDVKVLYVLSELIGYALSKFIGIRLLSSIRAGQRVYYIIGLMAFSEVALLGFALISCSVENRSNFSERSAFGHDLGLDFQLYRRAANQ